MESAVDEAILVELYRQERVTQYELTRALGISRMEVDAVLKKYNVTEDFPSDEEIRRALERLAEIPIE